MILSVVMVHAELENYGHAFVMLCSWIKKDQEGSCAQEITAFCMIGTTTRLDSADAFTLVTSLSSLSIPHFCRRSHKTATAAVR